MSNFEHTTGNSEQFPSMTGYRSPEQIAREAAQKEENAERSERAARLLAEEKARQAKEQAIEFDRMVLRNEEITAREVIQAIMEANPNFSEYQAKRLYQEKVREIVAIKRFESLYFSKPDTAKKMFSGIKM